MDELNTAEPVRGRSRAILSMADFDLLKEAVAAYIKVLPEGDPRSRQFSQLYHRLGRAD